MTKIKLPIGSLPFLREMDSRLISYNIEMTEVTGGTFWKLYTPAQIEGKEEVPQLADLSQMGSLLEMFPPADLQDQRALELAKALEPAYIRVSGSWATLPIMIWTAILAEKCRKASTAFSPVSSGTDFWIL